MRTTFRCVAFTPHDTTEFPPPPHEAREWTRCPTRSQRNDRFCRAHRDALDGLILGLHQWQQHLHGPEKENEAYSSIPEKTSSRKTRRKRASREISAQILETKKIKTRGNPRLPVAPPSPADAPTGNCPPAPPDERRIAPRGSG